MAQHVSAEKQARQAKKHQVNNRRDMSVMKTTIKKVLGTKEKEKAGSMLRQASKMLDQLASKGLIHRNKAANEKSRLAKYVGGLK